MSTSTPTIGAQAGAGSLGTPGTSVTNASNSLGENAFLQLMMDQLKQQDPTSPADPTQFLGELASFSSLEQEQSIAGATQQAAANQASAAAFQLLGKTVTYTDSSGTTASGVVSKVDLTSSGPTLTVGGESGITLSEIGEVSQS
jgi:flagellar basal-body rod modification protein FlgD